MTNPRDWNDEFGSDFGNSASFVAGVVGAVMFIFMPWLQGVADTIATAGVMIAAVCVVVGVFVLFGKRMKEALRWWNFPSMSSLDEDSSAATALGLLLLKLLAMPLVPAGVLFTRVRRLFRVLVRWTLIRPRRVPYTDAYRALVQVLNASREFEDAFKRFGDKSLVTETAATRWREALKRAAQHAPPS